MQKTIWFIAFQHPDLKKKKKKKRLTYRPSQFSGQKGKQTFIFLSLTNIYVAYSPMQFLEDLIKIWSNELCKNFIKKKYILCIPFVHQVYLMTE